MSAAAGNQRAPGEHGFAVRWTVQAPAVGCLAAALFTLLQPCARRKSTSRKISVFLFNNRSVYINLNLVCIAFSPVYANDLYPAMLRCCGVPARESGAGGSRRWHACCCRPECYQLPGGRCRPDRCLPQPVQCILWLSAAVHRWRFAITYLSVKRHMSRIGRSVSVSAWTRNGRKASERSMWMPVIISS